MRIKNLWAVAITVCTLLACSDSDNSMNEPIVQGKKAAITVKIKGSTVIVSCLLYHNHYIKLILIF